MRLTFSCGASHAAVWLVLLMGPIVVSESVRADDTTEAARDVLYTDRAKAIGMLEDAVQREPNRSDYWVELLYSLDVDSANFLSRCWSRAALAANPGTPDLLLARAALLQPSAALDIVDQLGRIEGQASAAGDARDMIALGVRVPFGCCQEQDQHRYWAARAVLFKRWQHAETIVERGLKLHPDDKYLLGTKAIVLAQRGATDEALAVQRQAGYPQEGFFQYYKYYNLAGLLLDLGKADAAVESYGGLVPEGQQAEFERLILAQAMFSAGDHEAARKVLAKCESRTATLLKISHLRTRGEAADAHQVAQTLVNGLDGPQQGSYAGPIIKSRFSPQALGSPVCETLSWLVEMFPKQAAAIKWDLGNPKKFTDDDPAPPQPVRLSTDKAIDDLEQKLLQANENEQFQLRANIVDLLAAAERYDEAAAGVQLALAAARSRTSLLQDWSALNWSLNRRRAYAVRHFDGHNERLIAVRKTIDNFYGRRYRASDTREWLSDHEMAARLTEMGAGVLACVYDAIERDFTDRWAWAQVIENAGQEQDVPVLIYYLLSTAERPSAVPNAHEGESAAAFNHTLEKLTKTSAQGSSPKDHAKFWDGWWQVNAPRIVGDSGRHRNGYVVPNKGAGAGTRAG